MGGALSLCFLLCAGKGTRLRPYTEKTPKPCLPFLDLPLAYYGFYLACLGGFDNFLLNKHYLPEQIEDLAKRLSGLANKIDVIDETAELLGSGGAIWNARDIIAKHDYFMIANGDEVLFPQNDNIIKKLTQQFQADSSLCTLLTCDHPELLKSLKPVWVNSQGQVRGFGMRKPDEEVRPVHYTGYKIFSHRILDFLPLGESNIFYDVLIKAIANGENITTLHLKNASWYETGTVESFLSASKIIAHKHALALERRKQFFSKLEPTKDNS